MSWFDNLQRQFLAATPDFAETATAAGRSKKPESAVRDQMLRSMPADFNQCLRELCVELVIALATHATAAWCFCPASTRSSHYT